MDSWLEPLTRYTSAAERIGLPLFLSLICLTQYGWYLYSRYCSRHRERDLQNNLADLEGEMNVLQQERYLSKIENSVLREVFQQAGSGRGIDVLLKTLVPNSSDGLALFFSFQEEDILHVFLHRGVATTTAATIRFDDEWLQRLRQEGTLRLSAAEVANSEFAAALSSRERKKLQQLFLFFVADEQTQVGVIATTHLFPPLVDWRAQQDLVLRVLDSVAGSLKQTVQLADRESLLRMTQEKLALRAIADRNYDTPPKLLDDYVQRLVKLVDADFGTVLLVTQNRSAPFRVITRQGAAIPPTVLATWQDYELRLARSAAHAISPRSLSVTELAELGVNTLMGSCLVLPLRQQNKSIGILLLARRDPGLFAAAQINLADWAANFLSATLLRVLDRVEVERMAQLDGLTELANRRMFDLRIQQELGNARQTGRELSLALFDLDRFKRINDTYGHQAGDDVLKHFARLLEQEVQQVRSTDTPFVARYGGEEMALLLPGVGLPGATRIAESIRVALESSTILFQGHRINPTVSIGLSCFPRHAQSAEAMIRIADQALYVAKQEGRNCVRTVMLPDAASELPAGPRSLASTSETRERIRADVRDTC